MSNQVTSPITPVIDMSGARSMAANNILLLRKADGKRQRDALRKAFKVIYNEN